MDAYFIGLDIGTTSTKAVAFSDAGAVLARHAVEYAITQPAPDRSEQDPDEIAAAAEKVLRDLQGQLGTTHRLQGVAFSVAMHTLMAVDAAGRPLTPLLIWADNRAAAQADALLETPGGMALYRATGVPVHPMSPLCKLIWLRQHEPDIFRRAACFVGIKEYIWHRIFGTYYTDHSVAAATGLLALDTLDWHPAALAAAGVEAGRLPDIKTIFHTQPCPALWAARTGLPAGTPLVLGGSDGCLANLGAGATVPDRLSVTVGTSGAARAGIPAPYTDPQMRTFCYPLTPDLYIAGGGMNNGGIVAEWLQERLFPGMFPSSDLLDAAVRAVPPGASGLLCLPYLLGERAPIYDPYARGVYFGVNLTHTAAHFARATLEGMAFAIYHTAQPLLAQFPGISALHLGGGMARLAFWVQVLADVSGKPVLLTDTVETSAFGAVVVGRQAIGMTSHWPPVSLEMVITRTFTPDPAQHEFYQDLFLAYRKLYDTLRPAFRP